MIEVYKIMSGKYDPEISNIFQHQEQENRNTRGHKYKLFKPRCRLNIRKNSFCIRVVNMWNSLPENVVTVKTLLTFERRLDPVADSRGGFGGITTNTCKLRLFEGNSFFK
jgi:acyl CoA:acetate/3-ketoacid CoA transferase